MIVDTTEPALASCCWRLLEIVGADRVTVRVDVAGRALHVDDVAAEACRPGVAGLRGDRSIDQRSLSTVRWLDANRSPLVQPTFRAAPFPPPELTLTYGVRAQILVPIEAGGILVGWVSVHSLAERGWSPKDVEAARVAAGEVSELLDLARS